MKELSNPSPSPLFPNHITKTKPLDTTFPTLCEGLSGLAVIISCQNNTSILKRLMLE